MIKKRIKKEKTRERERGGGENRNRSSFTVPKYKAKFDKKKY